MWLLILRVDFALLWGILYFFLSYVPYIGSALEMIPPILLGFAESGLLTAGLVLVGALTINTLTESLVAPVLVSASINLSPVVGFLLLLVWTWVLGPAGALLAMPLTLFTVLMLDAFSETRGLARLMSVQKEPKAAAQP